MLRPTGVAPAVDRARQRSVKPGRVACVISKCWASVPKVRRIVEVEPVPLATKCWSSVRSGAGRPMRPAPRAALGPVSPSAVSAAASCGNQFHVVHDDEAVEVRPSVFRTGRRQSRVRGIAVAPDGQISLDTALRIEHQIPCAAVSGMSFTVFVTMPLNQRKRSSPRTELAASNPDRVLRLLWPKPLFPGLERQTVAESSFPGIRSDWALLAPEFS